MNSQLVRSNNDKVLAGVCGGLARYFNIDTTIVRLVFVLAVLLGGVSPLVYVVLWIVMPQESALPPQQQPPVLPHQDDQTNEWQYDPYTGQRIQK